MQLHVEIQDLSQSVPWFKQPCDFWKWKDPKSTFLHLVQKVPLLGEKYRKATKQMSLMIEGIAKPQRLGVFLPVRSMANLEISSEVRWRLYHSLVLEYFRINQGHPLNHEKQRFSPPKTCFQGTKNRVFDGFRCPRKENKDMSTSHNKTICKNQPPILSQRKNMLQFKWKKWKKKHQKASFEL